MQLTLVDFPHERHTWAAELADRLGIRPGEWIPPGDPAFLKQIAAARPAADALAARSRDPAVFSFAADILIRKYGREIPADPAVLAASVLAIDVAARALWMAERLEKGPRVATALRACLQRAADLLDRSNPTLPDPRQRLVSQALLPLARLRNTRAETTRLSCCAWHLTVSRSFHFSYHLSSHGWTRHRRLRPCVPPPHPSMQDLPFFDSKN